MMGMQKEIVKYYQKGIEKNRLSQGFFQLEKERTQELILRFIGRKRKRLKILDVGAGTGFYSFWLRDLGHEVCLLDITPFNIEYARRYAQRKGKPLVSIQVGDARSLDFKSNSFDVVLLLGPLYHLTKKEDRIRALREARRVLGKGGLLICAAISRYAALLNGYSDNWINNPHFPSMVYHDLKDGQHRNPFGVPKFFTTAYLHRPQDLIDEMVQAGLRMHSLYAIESFGWLLTDFKKKWGHPVYKKLLFKMIRAVETEESLLGVSAHILGVGRL